MNSDISYKGLDYCDGSIDRFILRYYMERENIMAILEESPEELIQNLWRGKSFLSTDNDCQFRVGQGNEYTSFMCTQCKILDGLVASKVNIVNHPFPIECGKHVGEKLVIRKMNISETTIFIDREAAERNRLFLFNNPELLGCGTENLKDKKYLVSDALTNNILVDWVVSKIMIANKLPHAWTIYTGFLCHKEGYVFQESYLSLLDLEQIKDFIIVKETPRAQAETNKSFRNDVVDGIIMQLLAFFIALEGQQFIHGNAYIKSLGFLRKPCAYSFDGQNVTCSVTLKVGGFENSSIAFNNNILYSYNPLSMPYLTKGNFSSNIVSVSGNMAGCETKDFICKPETFNTYSIGEESIVFFSFLRNSGIALYPGSFDFYCFMVALIYNKTFYNTIMRDKKLYIIWSMMWLPEDIYIIDKRLIVLHQDGAEPTTLAIVESLRGLQLRCNITRFLWDLIRKLQI